MNSYHVYYNELFRKGKTELLPMIKRKNSEACSSPSSGYEHSQGMNSNSSDLSHENFMLKKLNQKAFAKINFLEAKINDLVHENTLLVKRISEKQKSEDALQSAVTHYLPEQDSATKQEEPIHAYVGHTNVAFYPPLYPKKIGVIAAPAMPTRSLSGDSISTEDSIHGAYISVPALESYPSYYSAPASFHENPGCSLMKRSFSSFEDSETLVPVGQTDFAIYEKFEICEAPEKHLCVEEDDKKLNLIESEFSFFSNGIVDDVF